MKNFIFKSSDPDLQKIVSIMVSKLELLNKNIIYVTYKVDKILKIEQGMMTDKSLQKQVDDYFDEDTEHIPEEDKEPD